MDKKNKKGEKMKSTFYLLTMMLLVMTFFTACEKSSTEPSSITSSNNPSNEKGVHNESKIAGITQTYLSIEDYETIAKVHNKGLDFVYDGLNKKLNEIKSKAVEPMTLDEIKSYTQTLVSNFLVQQLIEAGVTSYSNEEWNNVQILFSYTINNDWSDPQAEIEQVQNSNLDSIVKKYLAEILSIDDKNYGQYISALSRIENELRKENISDDNRSTIIGAIILSQYSVDYWKKNEKKWDEMLINAGYTDLNEENPCYVSGAGADMQVASFWIRSTITYGSATYWWLTGSYWTWSCGAGVVVAGAAVLAGSAGQWATNKWL